MVVELGVGRSNHRIDVGAGIDDQHRVHPFVAAAACSQADDRRLAHARQLVQHLLHIFWEDVQPLGRDDHFLLAAADEHLAVGADLADVAGVEPPVLERLRGFGGGVEVALRDVLSPHQDLAIVGHLHLDAGDRLANRAALRAERMVERHDRCGLGQPVALDDREPEVAPPLLEVAIERGGPDHERPELRAEQAMCITVMPPAAGDARHGTGRAAALQPGRLYLAGLFRRRRASQYMFAEHIEDLWDGDEYRNPAALHLVGDVAGVVAAHEDHRTGQHRRNERGHGLPEHVAERQQVQEPERAERFRVLAVLQHLAFDRDDVRKDVPVRDHHALRLGRGARREDDLGDIVASDGHRRRQAGGRPVEVVQRPRGRLPKTANRRHVLAEQHDASLDDARDAQEEIGRRTVINRDEHDAAEQASPEGHQPLGPVLAEDHDLVALGEASLAQPCGKRT